MRLRRIQVRTRRQASDERMEKASLKRNGFIVAGNLSAESPGDDFYFSKTLSAKRGGRGFSRRR
jgi:hypothetical protein